jgi:6-phosphogluconolactonase (cycloisomerase 2 family)
VSFRGVYLVDGFELLEIFERDAASGDLTAVQNMVNRVEFINPEGEVEGLYGTTSIVISPDGRHLYTAAHLEDAVSVFSREATTGELTFVQVIKDGKSGANGLEGAVSAIVSTDGRHVYVTAFEDDALTVFARDEATGSLAFVEDLKDGKRGVDGLDRPWSVAVSPDGAFVYTVGLNDNALVAFARESATGRLTPAQLLRDDVDGVDGLGGAISIAVSPDGRHVYAVSVSDAAVSVFSVAE